MIKKGITATNSFSSCPLPINGMFRSFFTSVAILKFVQRTYTKKKQIESLPSPWLRYFDEMTSGQFEISHGYQKGIAKDRLAQVEKVQTYTK